MSLRSGEPRVKTSAAAKTTFLKARPEAEIDAFSDLIAKSCSE
jgi:hypothetical protein